MMVLANRTKGTPPDQPKLAAYWTALVDVPLEVLCDAIEIASATVEFFPSVAELRQFCDEVKPYELTAGTVDADHQLATGMTAYEDGGQYHCQLCRDSGFVYVDCTPEHRCDWSALCRKRIAASGNLKAATHTYVRKCACRETNPVFLARIDRDHVTYYRDPRTRG